MTLANLDRLHDLLDQLDSHFVRVGIPQPLPAGLTEEQIAEETESLPYALPIELRTLYAWHDGLCTTRMPMGHPPRSLRESVEIYHWKREWAIEFAFALDRTQDEVWPPSWFTYSSASGLPPVMDCTVPEGHATPVMVADPLENDQPYPLIVADSFTQLIAWWVELFDQGIYNYDPTTGYPTDDFLRMPTHYRHVHVL
jgi:hypothetical protein